MSVAMLGGNPLTPAFSGGRYQYSLSAYERPGTGLGADWSFISDPKFWSSLGGAIKSGVGSYVDIINAQRGKSSDPNYQKMLDALLSAVSSGKFTGADADREASKGGIDAYLPWIIGGAAVLIMGMFMLGTRR